MCIVCFKGKVIKKNCILFFNVECDDKCVSGFYFVLFIFDCFFCVKCCGDGKDEMVLECVNYENKCKVCLILCLNFLIIKFVDIMMYILKILLFMRFLKIFIVMRGKRYL